MNKTENVITEHKTEPKPIDDKFTRGALYKYDGNVYLCGASETYGELRLYQLVDGNIWSRASLLGTSRPDDWEKVWYTVSITPKG